MNGLRAAVFVSKIGWSKSVPQTGKISSLTLSPDKARSFQNKVGKTALLVTGHITSCFACVCNCLKVCNKVARVAGVAVGHSS